MSEQGRKIAESNEPVIIDADGMIRLTRVKKRINCECGYALALEGPGGALLIKASVAVVHPDWTIYRCGNCKKTTRINQSKRLLNV